MISGPDYRRLERLVRLFPPHLRLLTTTATANNRVMTDLKDILGSELHILKGDLNRPSLTLQTMRMPKISQRMAWLADYLSAMPGSGIIYTLTKQDAQRLAAWLQSQNLDVAAYTGAMESGERLALEEKLLSNRVKALVATVALGMGYDKPDLGFVIHYQAPGSVVSYYQQVGRAGRDGNQAYGILLSGREETEITDFFIRSAFPSHTEVQQVIEALERAPDGLTMKELETAVNISPGRLVQTTKILALEAPAPILKQGSKWYRLPARLSPAFWDRIQRLTALRQAEQQQMQEYVALPNRHMQFLIEALDSNPGTVTPPGLPPVNAETSPATQRIAEQFLRRSGGAILPRKQWPGSLGIAPFRGNIRHNLRANPGRALCCWGDGAWGRDVEDGKYHASRFSEDLVQACVDLIANWAPTPRPRWVTCIPSSRYPELVPDFARRLAAFLRLPFRAALHKVRDHPPQKQMANSAHQCKNMIGAMEVVSSHLHPGPVLLVDDMVDSRWTFTMATWLLRQSGSGDVWPLALAHAGLDYRIWPTSRLTRKLSCSWWHLSRPVAKQSPSFFSRPRNTHAWLMLCTINSNSGPVICWTKGDRNSCAVWKVTLTLTTSGLQHCWTGACSWCWRWNTGTAVPSG